MRSGNRPVYAAIGVLLAWEKDVLGLLAGTGGDGGEVLAERAHRLENRSITDVFFLVCDGPKGLPG